MEEVCMEPLQDVLNFKSPKARKYFTNCTDNHKAWQNFEIFLHGMTMELIQCCKEELKVMPSPLQFFDWQHKNKSATIKFMGLVCLTYGLGIYSQRVGDRNNDTRTSNAGRYAFLPFFLWV